MWTDNFVGGVVENKENYYGYLFEEFFLYWRGGDGLTRYINRSFYRLVILWFFKG